MRKTSEILKIQFFIGSRALGKICYCQLLKCKGVLGISKWRTEPRHSLRSFVNHFQRQNHQGNLPFYRRNRKPHMDKTPKPRTGMAALTGRNSASAIKGNIGQNSSCTHDFTWIHDVHAVTCTNHNTKQKTDHIPQNSCTCMLKTMLKSYVIKVTP